MQQESHSAANYSQISYTTTKMGGLSLWKIVLLVGCSTNVWSVPTGDSGIDGIGKEEYTKGNLPKPAFLQGPRPTGPTATGNATASGEVQGLFATNENSLFVMSGPNSNAIANLTSSAAYFAEPYNTTDSNAEGGETSSQNMAGFTVTAQEDTQAYAEGEYIQFINHGASYATGWGESTADGQTYNPGPGSVAPAEPSPGWNANSTMGSSKPTSQDGKGNSGKPNQQSPSPNGSKPNGQVSQSAQNQQSSSKPPTQDGKGNGRPNYQSQGNAKPNNQANGQPQQSAPRPNNNAPSSQGQQSSSRPNGNGSQSQQAQPSQSRPNGNANQPSQSRPNGNSNQNQQSQPSQYRPNNNQNQQSQSSQSKPNSNVNGKPNQQVPSKGNSNNQQSSKPNSNNQAASKPNGSKPNGSMGKPQDGKGNKPNYGKPQKPKTEDEDLEV